jgi:hypothetical protein
VRSPKTRKKASVSHATGWSGTKSIWRRHAADRRIVRAAARIRVQQQQIRERSDAGLNPPGTLWRMGGDVIEDRAELGKSRKGAADPHRPCLDRPHLFIACNCRTILVWRSQLGDRAIFARNQYLFAAVAILVARF